MKTEDSKEDLTKNIKDAIYNPDINKRIIITPLINKEQQINSGAIDLRLGTEFILAKKTRFSDLNPKKPQLSSRIKEYQERITIRFKGKLVLHPVQVVDYLRNLF